MEQQTNTALPKQKDDTITLANLWRLCVVHWRWFVLSVAITASLATYYLIVTPKVYTREAAALVKIESQGKTSSNKNGDEFNDLGLVQQTTNVNNVLRQFSSLDVICEVVKRLKLAPAGQELHKAEMIRNILKVELDDEKSTIINLKITDTDPQRAEQILSNIIQVYNEKTIDDKRQMTANTSRFIEDRLNLIANELGGVDDSISAFKKKHQITDIDRVSDLYLEQQSQSEAQILAISNQKAMAEYIRGILHDKSQSHQLLPTNSGLNNTIAEAQIQQYNSQLLALNNHLAYTSEQNPLIANEENQLTKLRSNILQTIDNHIKTLDIQLGNLYDYSSEAESKINSSPNQAKHLTSVQRQQKVKESLYLYLLQKKEENEISFTYTSYNTQMIDMPHGSNEPTSPNTRNILCAAIVLGLLLPTVVIFIRESMNNTIRDRYDIEGRCTISLIGEIPYFKGASKIGKDSILSKLSPFKRRSENQAHSVVVTSDSRNMVNDAFRLLRTNIEFMTEEKAHNNNVFIVTSYYSGAGKTFVSTNLAIALAIKGKRILFIDGDLRHASASKEWKLNLMGTMGLSDYLGGKCDLDIAKRSHPDYPQLDLMPVGTFPPNPTELLSSEKFKEMIAEMKQEYDYVLIDCPPISLLADTTIIERNADRTLFVARVGLFNRNRIPELEAEYRSGKFKHLSIILNGSKFYSPNGHYGYNYGYYYYNHDDAK